MASKNMNSKGRKCKGQFLLLPHALLNYQAFVGLSARASKLLIDLGLQYNGYNNGDLCASMTLMRKRGWHSCDQLDKAKKELVKSGLVILTRQGGRHCASLYALAWRPIDYCKGKLDVPSTDKAALSFR